MEEGPNLPPVDIGAPNPTKSRRGRQQSGYQPASPPLKNRLRQRPSANYREVERQEDLTRSLRKTPRDNYREVEWDTDGILQI